MAKQSWKGSTLLGPLPPVLVSCGTLEKPNILTIAWTGIINTHPPKTYISIRPERFSYPLIKESGEFVINLPTKPLVRAVDFCGVRSGKDTDKFEKCSLHAEPATKISCPMIAESPLSLECKVTDEIPLGTHNMLLADIVAVNADESLLDKSGKLDMGRAQLIAFAHGAYYELGKQLGTFGYSVEKKSTKKRKKALNGSKDKRRQR
ncbi:MAG: flavin reductase family protein [Oscillospiraceae bacterium]|nr:flavin reductase family protein [Oscillospiraceae bacterium]